MFPLLAALAFAAADQSELQANRWHTDYAAALGEAKRTGKPLMLVFRCDP